MSFAGDPGMVTIRPQRSIGTIYPNITVSEEAVDELTITEHPVEQGATITDHAFKNPSQVRIIAGFSNSSVQAGGDPQYVNGIYQQFLDLQSGRTPFDVVTARRKYSNMLIKSLTVITDEKTENALMVTAVCQEIILVNTVTTTVPPADVQKSPQKNAPVQNTGTKQTAPAPNYNGG